MKVDCAIVRLLTAKESTSYLELSQVLKDVRILYTRGGINEKNLRRLVKTKAPETLKSLMILNNTQGLDFEEFIKVSVNAAWIVFKHKEL